MNKAFLIGRLTAEPESNTTNSGKTYCKFRLAVDKMVNGEKQADYLNVVCWEKTAENCTKYLSKGKQVAVVGAIQTGSYEKDGRKIQTFDIRAEQVEFLSKAETPKDGSIDDSKETDDDAGMPF